MILLTRLNGTKIYVNAEMIRSIEVTPDTILTLSDERKILVQESAEVVVERFIEYKRKVNTLQVIQPDAAQDSTNEE
jgi:flagellar protein FlbD